MAQTREGWDFISPVETSCDFFPAIQQPQLVARHLAVTPTAGPLGPRRGLRLKCGDVGRAGAALVGEQRPVLLQLGSLSCLPRSRLPAPAASAAVPSRLSLGVAQLRRAVWAGRPGAAAAALRALRARGSGSAASSADTEDEASRAQERVGRAAWTALAHVPNSWFGDGGGAAALWASAAGGLLTALAPLATVPASGGTLAAMGSSPALAFCPFPLAGVADLPGLKHLHQYTQLPELSLQDLERGILVATFLQGSLGLTRICLGDFFTGSYTLLLATLGFNARHPGPASNWLKTYVLITFINGTMGSIDLIQSMLLQNFPTVLLSLPLSVNILHSVQLLAPGVSFMGAYCGWQHIKMQRRLATEAYQQQLLMLMEQTPWPPPPLPFPLPGMGGGVMQVEDGLVAPLARSPTGATSSQPFEGATSGDSLRPRTQAETESGDGQQ